MEGTATGIWAWIGVGSIEGVNLDFIPFVVVVVWYSPNVEPVSDDWGIWVVIFVSKEGVIVWYSPNVVPTVSKLVVGDGVVCKFAKSNPKSKAGLGTTWVESIVGVIACGVSKGTAFDDETNSEIILS